jgi:hypothetical protein
VVSGQWSIISIGESAGLWLRFAEEIPFQTPQKDRQAGICV